MSIVSHSAVDKAAKTAIGPDVSVHTFRIKKLTEPGDNFATEVVSIEAEVKSIHKISDLETGNCSTISKDWQLETNKNLMLNHDLKNYVRTSLDIPARDSTCRELRNESKDNHFLPGNIEETKSTDHDIEEKQKILSTDDRSFQKSSNEFCIGKASNFPNSTQIDTIRNSSSNPPLSKLKFSCVAKLNSGKESEFFQTFSKFAFANEIFFYTNALPVLNNELRQACGMSLTIPKYYNSTLTPNDELLLIEDIRRTHFKMMNKKTGLNAKWLYLAVEELAKLHAASYLVLKKYASICQENTSAAKDQVIQEFSAKGIVQNLPSKKIDGKNTQKERKCPLHARCSVENCETKTSVDRHSSYEKVYKFLSSPNYVSKGGPVFHILVGLVKVRIETALNVLEAVDGMEKAKAWLRHVHGDIPAFLHDQLSSCRDEFLVLCHGDTWTNNFMFSADRAALVDFQLVRPSSLASDLNYLLYTSHLPFGGGCPLDQLLDLYYTVFQKVVLGSGLQVPFSRAALDGEMEARGAWGVMGAILTLPMIFPPKWRGTDVPRGDQEGPSSGESLDSTAEVNRELVHRYRVLFSHFPSAK